MLTDRIRIWYNQTPSGALLFQQKKQLFFVMNKKRNASMYATYAHKTEHALHANNSGVN